MRVVQDSELSAYRIDQSLFMVIGWSNEQQGVRLTKKIRHTPCCMDSIISFSMKILCLRFRGWCNSCRVIYRCY